MVPTQESELALRLHEDRVRVEAGIEVYAEPELTALGQQPSNIKDFVAQEFLNLLL
jgi:hypothetical protein